jgi:hypothetical protein
MTSLGFEKDTVRIQVWEVSLYVFVDMLLLRFTYFEPTSLLVN